MVSRELAEDASNRPKCGGREPRSSYADVTCARAHGSGDVAASGTTFTLGISLSNTCCYMLLCIATALVTAQPTASDSPSGACPPAAISALATAVLILVAGLCPLGAYPYGRREDEFDQKAGAVRPGAIIAARPPRARGDVIGKVIDVSTP